MIASMQEDSEALCMCPIQGIIDIIGKKWSILVVNAIGNHRKLRFNGIRRELKGLSPRTLSQTLKDLETYGLIVRESFNEIPPRVEYSLTKEGADLRRALIPLLHWALARTDDSFKSCCGLPIPTQRTQQPQGPSYGVLSDPHSQKGSLEVTG